MLQLCVLKKGRKIPNHLYFRKMAKKSRPARKQLCAKHKQLHRSRVVGLKSPMSTRSKWHSSLLGEQMVKAISEPVCLYVFIAKKKWLVLLPVQMLPDCDYQKSSWSLLP